MNSFERLKPGIDPAIDDRIKHDFIRDITRRTRTGLNVLLLGGAVALANGLVSCVRHSNDNIDQTSSAIGKVWDKNTPKDNVSPRTYWITEDKGYRLFTTNDSSDGFLKARISTTNDKGITWSTPADIAISDTGIPVNSTGDHTWSVMACKGGWCGAGRLITSNDRGVGLDANLYYHDWDESTYKASKGTKMPAPVNSTDGEYGFDIDPSGIWGLFGRDIAFGSLDIYQVKLGDWSSVKAVKGLDTPFVDGDPFFLSSTKILFTSNRFGGKGGKDVWVANGYNQVTATIKDVANFTAVNNVGDQYNGSVDTKGEYCWEDEVTDPEGGPSRLKIKCDQDVIKTIFPLPDAGTDSSADAVPDAPSDSSAETGVKPEAGDSTVADSPDAGSDATTDASMDSGSGDADADGTDGATDSAETMDSPVDSADTAPKGDTGRSETVIPDTSSDTLPTDMGKPDTSLVETATQCPGTPFETVANNPAVTVTSCDKERLRGFLDKPVSFTFGGKTVTVTKIHNDKPVTFEVKWPNIINFKEGVADYIPEEKPDGTPRYVVENQRYGFTMGAENSRASVTVTSFNPDRSPRIIEIKALEGDHAVYKGGESCSPIISGGLSGCDKVLIIPSGQTATYDIASGKFMMAEPSPETKPGCGPCNTIVDVSRSTREQVFGVFALLSLAAAAARRRKHGEL